MAAKEIVYNETARSLIVKEIACARKKTEAKIQAEIEKIFETN